ncbi:MAG: hypothetical protein U0790_12865 [Isosphaeraceae bacterium]
MKWTSSVLALGFSLVLLGGVARAQLPCNCPQVISPGIPVIDGGIVGQPVVTETAFVQPIATEGVILGSPAPIVGEPVVTGPIVGQPIVTGTIVSEGIVGAPGIPVGAPIIGGAGTGQVFPYSYFVNYPAPSRVYVGLGDGDQFPFYGRPYGNPGDRWSWYYMGGGERRYLAKYYYPILQ